VTTPPTRPAAVDGFTVTDDAILCEWCAWSVLWPRLAALDVDAQVFRHRREHLAIGARTVTAERLPCCACASCVCPCHG
jgi:hypothetical protein